MRAVIDSLIALGRQITFLPDNGAPTQPYTRELQRLGVEVLHSVDFAQELRRIGPSVELAILCRPEPASRWLGLVREHAPSAAIVYDTVDLHWLREARRAAAAAGRASGELLLTAKAVSTRELELALIRGTDATVVVTDEERAVVLEDVPDATVHVIANVNPVKLRVPPREGRRGVLFVGGFEHTPNVDAALALVREVMPLVWRELPDLQVTIVGPGAPPEIEALAGPLVAVAGWVANIDPLLDRALALVAPLDYGAGLKGKVTQALAAGLPVVTTPIGAEGLDAADGDQLLIGETAEQLADRVLRLVGQDGLWDHLSRAGQELAEARVSPALMRERLTELLAGMPSCRAS